MWMRSLKLIFSFLLLTGALAACQAPLAERSIPEDINSILATVDVENQRMRVDINGETHFTWKVSTARAGKTTPRGTYGAYWLSRDHKSSLYENAPMPFAIFFNGHYAVHGTDWEKYLGTPASAGCVRLSNANAELLFDLVAQHGKSVFTIEIHD